MVCILKAGSCALIVALGHRKATRDATCWGPARDNPVTTLRAAVNHGASSIEIDHQATAPNDITALIEFDAANQGNQPSIQVIDTELAARRFAGAADKNAAACIKPLHFNAIGHAARIGDRDPFCVERQMPWRTCALPEKMARSARS